MPIILVCGDRHYKDAGRIRQYLTDIDDGLTTIIHGAARGADTLAGDAAKSLNMPVMVFPAEWNKYGRAAGPIRNQQMLDEGQPTLVVYFHDNLSESKGTKDMVRRAKKAGIPVIGNPGEESSA